VTGAQKVWLVFWMSVCTSSFWLPAVYLELAVGPRPFLEAVVARTVVLVSWAACWTVVATGLFLSWLWAVER
jgi:hypothetical protein